MICELISDINRSEPGTTDCIPCSQSCRVLTYLGNPKQIETVLLVTNSRWLQNDNQVQLKNMFRNVISSTTLESYRKNIKVGTPEINTVNALKMEQFEFTM